MLSYIIKILLFLLVAFSGGYSNITVVNNTLPTNLHDVFTERIGNFSIELLYHTSKSLNKGENLVLSPMTVWTVLAVITEGAVGNTYYQLSKALRLSDKNLTRMGFQNLAQWLKVHSDTVHLEKLNTLIVDEKKLPENDFRIKAKDYYDTDIISLNFSENAQKLANNINEGISKFTHGKIDKLVDESYFSEANMILVSALYFKGQWTVPFNTSNTVKRPFYDSNGIQVGEVNMMYNRYTYPYANLKELKARIVEVPYGVENRLTMLVMLPYPNVSLWDMFKNFLLVPLDTVFKELRVSRDEYSDDEVDLFLPRFKIQSSLVLTETIKKFGIYDLFDMNTARLPYLARTPLYVTKIVHKADIEVTEDGTEAAAVTAAEFANRIGVARFEANRPFTYLIIEKVTNSIVFGGIYETPSLY